MGVMIHTEQLNLCQTCQTCKMKVKTLQLDTEKKDTADCKLDLLDMDLLVPARKDKGAVLLCIHLYSRLTLGEHVIDYSTETLLTAYKRIELRFGGTPKRLILDRQTGFVTKKFHKYLTSRRTDFRAAPLLITLNLTE